MPVKPGMNHLDDHDRLIHFIQNQHPQGSLKNKVTIVFDGRPGPWQDRSAAYITVIFSQDRSADDIIRLKVEDSSRKKSCIVVTDDRAVQYAVKALGAKVLSVSDFLGLGERKKTQHNTGTQGSDQSIKKLSSSLEQEITQQMEEVWLSKKKKNKD